MATESKYLFAGALATALSGCVLPKYTEGETTADHGGAGGKASSTASSGTNSGGNTNSAGKVSTASGATAGAITSNASVGGSPGSAGDTASYGGSASLGGAEAGVGGQTSSASGGTPNTAGATATGGTVANGGTTASGGIATYAGRTNGGTATNGGTVSTGGVINRGGAAGMATGGTVATGGIVSAGGAITTGGTATGGAATGGRSATGGVPPATGGAYVDDPTVCDDTATFTASMTAQYARTTINTTNNPNKSYVAQANWWGKFANQQVDISGLGFTVTNSVATDNPSNPIGFPSLYIGSFAGVASSGSNLPMLVSSITHAPTVLETNVTTLDTSNFDAAYDLWFTPCSDPLAESATSLGPGGAYLMIWLYKPSNKQPQGVLNANVTIDGKGWAVWTANGDPPIITYVPMSPLTSLQTDLKPFISDAVSRGIVSNSMYLALVFAGFEIWSGANGAKVTKFCAKVSNAP